MKEWKQQLWMLILSPFGKNHNFLINFLTIDLIIQKWNHPSGIVSYWFVSENLDKVIMEKTVPLERIPFLWLPVLLCPLKYLMRTHGYVYSNQEKFEKEILFLLLFPKCVQTLTLLNSSLLLQSSWKLKHALLNFYQLEI